MAFAAFLLSNWRWVIIGGLCIALLVQTARYEFVEMAFEEFKIETRTAGRVQEEQTKARIAEERAAKEKADAENARAVARLNATIRKLRDERASSSFVPNAASATASPERACFDRPELERALRDFDSEAARLVDEGSKAVVDLDTAKRWAQNVAP